MGRAAQTTSLLPLLASAVLEAACGGGGQVESRTVTLHVPASCAPRVTPSPPFALFYPFGDFQPSGDVTSLPLDRVGDALSGVPSDARELVVDVTDSTDGEWAAHALVPSAGDVDLLLLPSRSPCALTGTLDARGDAALAALDPAHLLIAGGSGTGGAIPTTVVVDLARGSLQTLASGLLVPRVHPTATAWSGGGLVAGGVRPDTGETVASAEVYSTASGDFDGVPIPLSQARARHAAVTLTTGQTLLVAGVGGSGDLLASMEIVDASVGRARTAGLATVVKRADPVAIRLASGEILVAGGVDASGAPVSTLEWFTPDGTEPSRQTQTLVASTRSAFIALPAGGALAVIAPDAPVSGFQNVWVLSADGGLEAATPIDGALSDVHLFAGTEGEPVLWTGDRWLVWQPWSGAFTALAGAIGAPGPTGDPSASPEPGLGAWLDGTTVHALRVGTRGPYASTPTSSPLLVTDPSFTAPDRLVLPGETAPISFDPTGGLALASGASVFVTDATYAAFTLDAETPGGTPPSIVLRDASTGTESVLDATACPVKAGATLHVERSGSAVRVSVDGGASVACAVVPAPDARLSVGFRGTASGSRVRSVVVARL
ncbi:MAG TPA: hypothetical protein VGI39_05125 [Polyangiaceae bacterium]|jgi:hypothetical protein